MPLVFFYTPWKHQKNLWFSDVIRGIKDTSDMKWVKAEEQPHMNSNQKQQFWSACSTKSCSGNLQNLQENKGANNGDFDKTLP